MSHLAMTEERIITAAEVTSGEKSDGHGSKGGISELRLHKSYTGHAVPAWPYEHSQDKAGNGKHMIRLIKGAKVFT